MELTFEKVGNQYVAEFQAPSDFNLHIEREEIGVLEVHQRGSEEGKYDFAWSTGVSGRKVVDYDFGALVYPKWIKVVSGSEVVSASVNFNEGGGSGSGSGDSETWEYLDVSSLDGDGRANVGRLSTLVRVVRNGEVQIANPAMIYTDDTTQNYTLAVAMCTSLPLITASVPDVKNNKEFLNLIEIQYGSFPRITKEQFYNLEA